MNRKATDYIRFDPAHRKQIQELGLNYSALAEIFLPSDGNNAFPFELVEGASTDIRGYIKREYCAARFSFDAVVEGQLSCPDPWGEDWVTADWVMTPPARGSLPFDMLSVCYRCQGSGGRTFWVCAYQTYGRVTQVYFPELDCAIYDFDPAHAREVIKTLCETVIPLEATAQVSGPIPAGAKRIGLLDMVSNFGHQLLNHLSGVQRLVEDDLLDRLDEIWLCGTEFFGAVENIFPALRGRVRRFEDRWTLHAELLRQRVHLFKIGSNLVTADLQQRILDRAGRSPDSGYRKLVVTVRAEGRRCLNLVETVAQAYASLRPAHPDLRVVLDGWVIPESGIRLSSSLATALQEPLLPILQAEMELAERIIRVLPAGAVIGNTIGRSMLESLAILAGSGAYLSHIGTLQHKLGILVGLPGVVHGPRKQLDSPESGPFMSEVGFAPDYLPVEVVEDVQVGSERGAGYDDYLITDPGAVAARLDRVLRQEFVAA